ncbi:MAG TPA: tetratricopeptide repeat protein [Candidatus Kapabacteria bacterium]|nr:tetratricopeptide repeat protein [Candidatus Kapabacteria bacterium]
MSTILSEPAMSCEPSAPSPHDAFPLIRIAIVGIQCDIDAERAWLAQALLPELSGICRARGGDIATCELAGTDTAGAYGETIFNHPPAAHTGQRIYVLVIVGSNPAVEGPPAADGRDARTDPYRWRSAGTAGSPFLLSMEALAGALRNPALAGRMLFFPYDPAPEHPEAYATAPPPSVSGTQAEKEMSYYDAMPRRRRNVAAAARERILDMIRSSGQTLHHTVHTREQLLDLVRRDLMDLINRLFPAATGSPLDAERRMHRSFARSRTHAYMEIPGYLERLDDFLNNQPGTAAAERDEPERNAGLVVSGESGAGKSALLAYWCERIRSEHPHLFIVQHHVAAASAGNDGATVLRHIMAEIRERLGVDDPLPTDAAGIREAFPLWLGHLQHENLVLVVDGLDQLDEASRDLSWLPEHIPPHVLLIVSTTDTEPLAALHARAWPELRMVQLTQKQRRDLITRYVREFGEARYGDWYARIGAGTAGGNPLYLRTQLERLNATASGADEPALLNRLLAAETLPELFDRVLEQLEGRHGVARMRTVLTLLWAARRGLARQEIAAIGLLDEGETEEVLASLGCHLIGHEGLFRFHHDGFRRAVERRYLVERPGRIPEIRERIADWFASQPIARRHVEEIPWQAMHAGAWRKLHTAIADIRTASMLLADGDPYELLQYWRALENRYGMVETYRTAMQACQLEANPSLDLVAAREAIAGLLLHAGHYAEAEHLCRTALEERGAAHGEDNPTMLPALDSYATLLYHTGEWERAIRVSERALRLREAASGMDAKHRARNLAALGAMYHACGDHAEADIHLLEALCLANDADEAAVAMIVNNLGAMRVARGDFAEAAMYFERALAVNGCLLGEGHLETASNRVNLGFALQQMGNTSAAAVHYRHALACAERILGARHPRTALFLTSFGMMLRDSGELEEGEQLLRRAYVIRRDLFGADALETAGSATRLAGALRMQGRLGEAFEIYSRAIPIHEAHLGATHPDIISLHAICNEIQAQLAYRMEFAL